MEKALVLGASGATGRLLVQSLLKKGGGVVAIVRNAESLSFLDNKHRNLHVVEAEISEMPERELARYLTECNAVFSCLGHNMTFKGLFGHPRRLVTDAVIKVTRAIESVHPDHKIKMVLMNTSGNSNRDIPEKPPFTQRLVIALVRMLLPPHADNEQAADFLRLQVGQNNENMEWVVVRPDSLINEEQVSNYDMYASPIRNALFDAGKTSRINVADFMAELVINKALWEKWKGQMPVIYDQA